MPALPGIASAATAVVIGHVAGGTSRIRVGAGGIMLPNHSPLVIAEQFGTLAELHPGRIDLGLGRAPGTDQITWGVTIYGVGTLTTDDYSVVDSTVPSPGNQCSAGPACTQGVWQVMPFTSPVCSACRRVSGAPRQKWMP